MLIEGFSQGFVATASLVAAMFFLRFWTRTRDFLFMAFAIAFAAEAVTRTIMVLKGIPDTDYSWVYLERLCGVPLHSVRDSAQEPQSHVVARGEALRSQEHGSAAHSRA